MINHIKRLNEKEAPLLKQFINYTEIYREVIVLNQNFDYSRLKHLRNGIENKKDENNIKINNLNEENNLPISMILFDELGLAERSKYNPLKALHGHLEFDGNGKDISFVGISNWTLDAAKVNRALSLSVPDLESNEKDLALTSISFNKS